MKYVGALFALVLFFGSIEAKAKIPRLSSDAVADKLCQNDSRCQRFVKRHLIRDLKRCQIDPAYLENTPVLMDEADLREKEIKGRVAYMGFAAAPYRYRVESDGLGGLVIKANVYFTNLEDISKATLARMQSKLTRAADQWTNASPYSFPLRFEFKLTDKRSEAHVRTKLKMDGFTRGPYFSKWSSSWSSNTVAHEMGHVLGLDDEYSNNPFGGSLGGCNRRNLMCVGSTPRAYYYYMIVRRALCRV